MWQLQNVNARVAEVATAATVTGHYGWKIAGMDAQSIFRSFFPSHFVLKPRKEKLKESGKDREKLSANQSKPKQKPQKAKK